MKIIPIFFVIILMMVSLTVGIRDYGNHIYGNGEYGENTPPNIDDFQPTDTTPQFNFTTNVTFNITFSDDDGDALTLGWFVNQTFNISNQNLSYIFNNVGIFNITGNVSDGLDSVQQEWLVTIINDTQAVVPGKFVFKNKDTKDTLLWIDNNGRIYFDTGDFIEYDTTNNRFFFYIADVIRFCINTSGGNDGACA